jgi:hypothetical protein
MRRLPALLLGIPLFIGPLCSQTFLSGPVEGFIFDLPTQSFRAVIGLPGSATFGPVLASGFDTGWVAPHKGYAIGFQEGNGFLIAGLNAGQVTTTSLIGLSGRPDAVAWSGDGSVAVLYSRTGSWMQTVNGLPDAPEVGSSVDLSPLGGSLSTIVTDSHGKTIALAFHGNNSGVFLLSGGQSFVSAVPMANPAALAFSSDDTSLYILDGNALQLTIFTLSDSSFQTFQLDGLQNPSAIAAGRDAQGRQVVYVADATDQIFRSYDPSTQQVLLDLPLDFQPTGIATFGPNSFVIARRLQTTDPLWLFASMPAPGVYFVPAASATSGGLN